MSLRVLAVCLAGAAALEQASAPQQPVFRTDVQLVRIDAVVVDAQGRAVEGLTKDDFELVDSGWTRPIANFVEVRHQRPAARGLPWSVPRDVGTNLVADRGRIVVIVLDDYHVRKEMTEKTRQVAVDFVNSVGDDAVMALLSITGRYNVELTQDRGRILRVLESFEASEPKVVAIPPSAGMMASTTPRNPRAEAEVPDREQYTSVAEQRQLEMLRIAPIGGVDSGMAAFKPPPRSTGGDPATANDSLMTMKVFEDAARMLGQDDGRRKAFVWISTGLTYGAGGVRDAIEAMRRSGVVTYAIDPLGTGHFAPGGAYAKPGGRPTPWDGIAAAKRRSLREVADESGGFAVVNDDNLGRGLDRIIEDLDHYYVLGFYPEDSTTPGHRPVEVRMKRPGLTVRHRQGYSIGPPLPPKTKDTALGLALGAMSRADLPMRVFAATLPTGTAATRVAITVEWSSPRAGLAAGPDGRLSDTVDYAVLAVLLRSGHVVRLERNQAKMTFAPQPGQSSDTLTYGVSTAFTLFPGTYQLRASAVSRTLGKGGSVYLTIDVPNYTQGPLALSALILGEGRVPSARTRAGAALQAASPLPFQASLDREFTRAEGCRVFFEVVRAKPAVGAEVAIDLIDVDDRVVRTVPIALSPTDGGRVDRRISLDGVSPGGYRLRVTATQGPASVTREIAIVVK